MEILVDKRKKKGVIAATVTAIALSVTIGACGVYVNDYYRADSAEIAAFAKESAYTAIEKTGGRKSDGVRAEERESGINFLSRRKGGAHRVRALDACLCKGRNFVRAHRDAVSFGGAGSKCRGRRAKRVCGD